MNAARAFDQDLVAGAEILREPASGGFGIGQKQRRDSAGAGCGGQMFGVAADAGDQIEACFSGSASAGGVQRGSVFAEFEHLPGHQDAALGGTRGERVNHGAQSFWIGVVTVVEDGGARDVDQLAALVAGSERRERLDGGIEIDPCFKGDGEAGDGVGGVVRAEQMKR